MRKRYEQTVLTFRITFVQEVKNYGGWIMLKKLGITDCKQEPQLESRLKQRCCRCNGGRGSTVNKTSSLPVAIAVVVVVAVVVAAIIAVVARDEGGRGRGKKEGRR
jgi:hypothetical protein